MQAQDDFIRSTGLNAFRVGGSVRDELMGRKSKDADYVVFGHSLEDVKRSLAAHTWRPKLSKLQLRNGTEIGVRAHVKGLGLMEIALPRTERSTGVGHGDFEIVVDPCISMSEDALRRDFTINAIYRGLYTGQLTDPFGGIGDIYRREISTISRKSFHDDPLRILRALRFVAHGFDLSYITRGQMIASASATTGLTKKGVSGTVFSELDKMLAGPDAAKALREMRDTGVLYYVLPELRPILDFDQRSKYHNDTLDEHTFKVVDQAVKIGASQRVRWAALFHDSGKPEVAFEKDGRLHYYASYSNCNLSHEEAGSTIAYWALKRLNAPKNLYQDVVSLVRLHMVSLSGRTKPLSVYKWRCELGDELLDDLLKLRWCDVSSKGGQDEAKDALRRLHEIQEEAKERGLPASRNELALSGGDLYNMGLREEEIGATQRKLLHEVLCGHVPNEKEALMEKAFNIA